MARLPDVAYRPVDLAASRATARIDATPIAEGEAALAGAVGRGGEALARALQQSGNIGRVLEEAGGAQGRAVMEVGERIGRGLRKAGAEAGTAVIEGGTALAKATREAGAVEAKGLAAFGTGLESIGKAAYEIKAANDRMDYARATSGFVNEKSALDAAFAKDQDYKTSTERYGRMIGDIGEKWGREVRDEAVRAQFLRDVDSHAVRGVFAVQRHAFAREREDERARLFADLDQHLENARNAKDDERGGIIRAGHLRIAAAVDKGHLTPGEAQALRTKWTHDYATASLQARPLDEQIALLEKRLNDEQTELPVDYLPRSKAAEMHKHATVSILEEKRRVESEAALERQKVQDLVNKDIDSIAATGKGVLDLDAKTVERVLGPVDAREWEDRRVSEYEVWRSTHDLSTLADSQIDARLKVLEHNAKHSDHYKAIHAEVTRKAAIIRGLRRNDPARSVYDDPSVVAARLAVDRDHPEAFQAVVEARLAAQARAGIPEEQRSAIMRSEALRLTEPLVRAHPDEDAEVRLQILGRFHAMFGRHATAALAHALRFRGIDARPVN